MSGKQVNIKKLTQQKLDFGGKKKTGCCEKIVQNV